MKKRYNMPVCNEYQDKHFFYHHTAVEKPDPRIYKMHCHEKYEILVVLSGSGYFCAEGRKYSLGKDKIYISRPGELHGVQLNPSVPYDRVAYRFSPELLEGKPKFLTDPFNNRGAGCDNQYSVSRVGHSARMLTTVPDNVKGVSKTKRLILWCISKSVFRSSISFSSKNGVT